MPAGKAGVHYDSPVTALLHWMSCLVLLPHHKAGWHAACIIAQSLAAASIGVPDAFSDAEEADEDADTDSDEDALLSAFEDVLAGWAMIARLPQRLASSVGPVSRLSVVSVGLWRIRLRAIVQKPSPLSGILWTACAPGYRKGM